VSAVDWLALYRGMVTIRLFEEQVNELYRGAKMPGLAHLYIGEEAVAVGVCSALRRDDYITSTHRGHGHCLAKGADVALMFAELLGKEAGYCKGKGGSMHIADHANGNLGANAIVGGSTGIATGAAFSAKRRGTDQVAACFFGDGALGQGILYEVMNMASLWSLPVVYVCENNLYAASTPVALAFAIENIADRAAGYGMPGKIVDGNDVLAVREAAAEAVERARRGQGPTLVEYKTYRQVGHSRSDPRTYRTREEEAEWQTKDPILKMQRLLVEEEHLASQDELDEIGKQVVQVVDDAVAFAESSPYPRPEETLEDVFYGAA
jgi:pyruvate dehydrogenase E1 component alpha subunit